MSIHDCGVLGPWCRLLHREVMVRQLTDFACEETMVDLHDVMLGVGQIRTTPVQHPHLGRAALLGLTATENL